MEFPYPVGPHAVPLFLAPMAGITESAFRLVARRQGADVVLTEFLNSEAIRRRISRVLEGCEFDEIERPVGIQIYGADPGAMEQAAALVTEHYQPDFIDINFGCPVKRVVKRNGGSGCLQDLDLVETIIRRCVAATHLPVSVKTRSGWSEETRDPVGIALRMQDAGARVFTLHARTRSQMYSGKARWDEIAQVVEALDVPVIGNGDVVTAADALRMREHTGCAAIMVGRGCFGNPWLFRDARALLAGQPLPLPPDPYEKIETALAHARLAITYQGDHRQTMVEFRKHFGWYTRGLHQATALRARLFQVETLGEAEAVFMAYLDREKELLPL